MTGLGEGTLCSECGCDADTARVPEAKLSQCPGDPAVAESQDTPCEQSEERKKEHTAVSADAESVQQIQRTFTVKMRNIHGDRLVRKCETLVLHA